MKQEFGYAAVGMTNLFGGDVENANRFARSFHPLLAARKPIGRDDRSIWNESLLAEE
jgi:hypothetical protein